MQSPSDSVASLSAVQIADNAVLEAKRILDAHSNAQYARMLAEDVLYRPTPKDDQGDENVSGKDLHLLNNLLTSALGALRDERIPRDHDTFLAVRRALESVNLHLLEREDILSRIAEMVVALSHYQPDVSGRVKSLVGDRREKLKHGIEQTLHAGRLLVMEEVHLNALQMAHDAFRTGDEALFAAAAAEAESYLVRNGLTRLKRAGAGGKGTEPDKNDNSGELASSDASQSKTVKVKAKKTKAASASSSPSKPKRKTGIRSSAIKQKAPPKASPSPSRSESQKSAPAQRVFDPHNISQILGLDFVDDELAETEDTAAAEALRDIASNKRSSLSKDIDTVQRTINRRRMMKHTADVKQWEQRHGVEAVAVEEASPGKVKPNSRADSDLSDSSGSGNSSSQVKKAGARSTGNSKDPGAKSVRRKPSVKAAKGAGVRSPSRTKKSTAKPLKTEKSVEKESNRDTVDAEAVPKPAAAPTDKEEKGEAFHPSVEESPGDSPAMSRQVENSGPGHRRRITSPAVMYPRRDLSPFETSLKTGNPKVEILERLFAEVQQHGYEHATPALAQKMSEVDAARRELKIAKAQIAVREMMRLVTTEANQALNTVQINLTRALQAPDLLARPPALSPLLRGRISTARLSQLADTVGEVLSQALMVGLVTEESDLKGDLTSQDAQDIVAASKLREVLSELNIHVENRVSLAQELRNVEAFALTIPFSTHNGDSVYEENGVHDAALLQLNEAMTGALKNARAGGVPESELGAVQDLYDDLVTFVRARVETKEEMSRLRREFLREAEHHGRMSEAKAVEEHQASCITQACRTLSIRLSPDSLDLLKKRQSRNNSFGWYAKNPKSGNLAVRRQVLSKPAGGVGHAGAPDSALMTLQQELNACVGTTEALVMPPKQQDVRELRAMEETLTAYLSMRVVARNLMKVLQPPPQVTEGNVQAVLSVVEYITHSGLGADAVCRQLKALASKHDLGRQHFSDDEEKGSASPTSDRVHTHQRNASVTSAKSNSSVSSAKSSSMAESVSVGNLSQLASQDPVDVAELERKLTGMVPSMRRRLSDAIKGKDPAKLEEAIRASRRLEDRIEKVRQIKALNLVKNQAGAAEFEAAQMPE